MTQYPSGPQMTPPMQPPMQPPGPPYGVPYGQPGMPMQPQKTSAAAVVSLICGIMGCIPFVTSIAAIILGIIGIRTTANPMRSGRPMAIIGLVLGVLGIAGWILFGGTLLFGLSAAKKMSQAQAQPFMQAIVSGDYSRAQNYSNMSQDQMSALHDQVKDWGSLADFSINSFDMQKNNGTPGRMTLKGTATFASAGKKDVTVTLDTQQGVFKVSDVEFK